MKPFDFALIGSALILFIANLAHASDASKIQIEKSPVDPDLHVVLLEGMPYATYEFFQAEEMPLDSSLLGAIARTCPTTRKEAIQGALTLCAQNGGVDCRIATQIKQIQKVSTAGDHGVPAIATQCTYTTFAIDLHNATDKVSFYDCAGPMYP